MDDKYLNDLKDCLKHAKKRFKKAQKRYTKYEDQYDFNDGMYWWGIKSMCEAAIKGYKAQLKEREKEKQTDD
jgi:hypothetical protein